MVDKQGWISHRFVEKINVKTPDHTVRQRREKKMSNKKAKQEKRVTTLC